MIYNAYQDTHNGIGGVSIVSCGHIFAQNGRKIDRPSGRPDFLLFYVVKGKEYFYLENESIAEEGSFIFFRPFEKQEHIYKENKKGEFYYIHFNAPHDFDLFGFKSSFVYNSELSTTICHIFEEIISELQKKQIAYEKFCVSRFFTLLSFLERKVKNETYDGIKHFGEISYIVQKMHMEYTDNCDLDDYAKICNMSKYHFLRIFKKIVGFSPLEYRNAIRLNYAKEQIIDTTIPINEIAEKSGFASPSYFCQAFKKRFGVPPSKYRDGKETYKTRM